MVINKLISVNKLFTLSVEWGKPNKLFTLSVEWGKPNS